VLNYAALKLTFADEFSIFRPKTAIGGVWNTSYHWGANTTVNNELQYYVDTTNNPGAGVIPFRIDDGKLIISAAPTPAGKGGEFNNKPYMSGAITSLDTFSQQYGYFEIKAQLPAGKGLWPAFWMLNADKTFPPELDIMEVIGSDITTLTNNLHWKEGETWKEAFSYRTVPDLSKDYHTYGVNWTSTKVTWFFDGNEVASAATPVSMNKPMYLLANLAVGGKWPGSPDATTKFPAEYKIDYIRAYSGDATTSITPPDAPSTTLPGADLKLAVSPSPTKAITGTTWSDVLNGTTGADKIDGRVGLDTMSGGRGGDTYVVDRSTDKVIERAGEGTDTVMVMTNAYILPQHVENGSIGSAFAFLAGNAHGNRLSGGIGTDILVGGKGNDLMYGKGGADTFVFRLADGFDVITDFEPGVDHIELQKFGFASSGAVLKALVDTPSGSALSLGASQAIHFRGIEPDALSAKDFILTAGGSDAGWLW
jgi:beta-glucanase (GH16 family)